MLKYFLCEKDIYKLTRNQKTILQVYLALFFSSIGSFVMVFVAAFVGNKLLLYLYLCLPITLLITYAILWRKELSR